MVENLRSRTIHNFSAIAIRVWHVLKTKPQMEQLIVPYYLLHFQLNGLRSEIVIVIIMPG